MPSNLLILYPRDAQQIPPDSGGLIDALHAIGFIADTFSFEGELHWRPGERFLELITFLGCSPVVSLGEPGLTGDEFCHIQFDGPLAQAQFIGGENTKPPRCPGCGYRTVEWESLRDHWLATPDEPWRCPLCGRTYRIPELNWRQCAGFGRYFIRVWGIFEGEAVPSEELMQHLRSHGGEWRHFYYRSR